MPSQNNTGGEASIAQQLEALSEERGQLQSAYNSGELSKADYTKAATRNEYLVAQLREQAEVQSGREAEHKADRKRDIFGD